MHDVVMQRKDSTNSTTLDISSLSPPVQASDPSVYVTKYVRELVTNQDKRDVVVKALLDHKPYVETEFMAVAMIDISGFSTLTTLFTDLLGKLSSEVISAGTGEYIEKIAPIVLGYGGDIVKFLGDALLVTFCANDPFEDHASIKSRAIMCCTEILLEHPTHAIDVKRWANAMSSAKDPFDRYDSNGGTRNMKRSEVLTLHAAVACGMVSRVIIGLPSFRLDYFVVGDCLHEIGPLLDGTKSGQLGVSHQISEIFPESLSFLKDLEQIILYSEHLEAIRFSGSRSSQGHRGSITGTTTIKTIPVQSNIVDLDMSFLTTFINQSVMARMRDSDIVLSATQSSPAGLKRRVTDFKSEYRTLSVLFMKPLKAFGLEESQIYMEEFLKSLMTYNGVFLQSSVDDKGQTFLACFGLPPFANENGCHNAIKTAVMFQTALKRRVVGAKFSMSIATGSVFFGTVGTRGRKEAGFLGDVFNLAVRLLSIEREYRLIAIDRTTRDAVKNDFVCMHLGKHKVKGKGKQVDVWGIPSDGLGSRARRKKEFTDPMGNVDELEALKASFDAWRLGITRKNLALVEGTSGMGKSNLLAFLEKHISQFGMDHCLGRGTEMGQTIPYSAIQVLLQKVLSLITFEADTASSKTGSMSSIGSLSPANDIQYFHSHEFRRRSTDVCQNAKLRNLLMDIGEDPAYVDLLNELLFGVRKNAGVASQAQAQYLTVGSTAGGVGVRPSKIQLLDAEGKRMVMKSVVTRMMAHVLGTKKVALILDDAQWIDPTSIDVICGVIETCKNLFLVSFSRPLMDDNRIKGMAYDQKYMLTGLRYIEIEKCLVERLRLGVKITPKLVKAVMEHTGGNLLQVDTLVTFLAEETEENTLDDAAIETILSTRIETLILTQFDRLDPFLQTLFKLASVLGHYFSLDDLLFLLNDPNITPTMISEAIVAGDRFGFMTVETFSGADTLSPWIQIHFRHITISKVIYESIPMVDRQRLHAMVGENYEAIVEKDPEERKMMLPPMCYHYWRSGNSEKMVVKNLELGLSYYDDGLFGDSTRILNDLFQFLEDNELQLDSTAVTLHEIFTMTASGGFEINREVKASALAKLSWASVNFVPFTKSRSFALQAMEVYGVVWPKTIKESKKETMRTLRTLMVSWVRSKGGTVDIAKDIKLSKTPLKNPPYGERRHTAIKQSLMTLSALGIMDSSWEAEYKFLVILKNLTHAIRLCDSDPEYWLGSLNVSAFTLARFGWGFRIGHKFYNTSLKIEHKCSDAVCSSYNIYSAIALAYESSPKRALGFSDRHTTYWMDRKVPMEACKGHPMRFAPSVMAGNMGVITALMPESLMAEMLVKESVWSVAVLASLMLEAMYAGNVPLLKRWNEMFEKAHFYLDDATTFVFSGVKGMGAVLINLSSQPHGAEIVENINDMVIRMGRVKLETNHSFVFKHVIVVFMACNVVVQRIRNSPEIDFVANNRPLNVNGADSNIAMPSPLPPRLATLAFNNKSRINPTPLRSPSVSLQELRQNLMALCKKTHPIPSPLLEIARRILLVCPEYLDGKGYKQVGWFKRVFRSRTFAGKMNEGGEFFGLNAFLTSVVGHLSRKKEERQQYATKAAGMFRRMGADTLEKWALMAVD